MCVFEEKKIFLAIRYTIFMIMQIPFPKNYDYFMEYKLIFITRLLIYVFMYVLSMYFVDSIN